MNSGLYLASMIPLTWGLSAIVDIKQSGDVAAHRMLDMVCVAGSGQQTVTVFNSHGRIVATGLAAPPPPESADPEADHVVMNSFGQLVLFTESDHFIPSTTRQEGWKRISEYRLELGKPPQTRSLLVTVEGGHSIKRSWSDEEAHFVTTHNTIEAVSWPNGAARSITPRTRDRALEPYLMEIEALPENRLAALVGINPKGNRDAVYRVAGVPIYGEDAYYKFFYAAMTYYLVTIDLTTGYVTPICGFFGVDQSLRTWSPRVMEVFNNGKSIAVQHLDKLYLFNDMNAVRPRHHGAEENLLATDCAFDRWLF